MAALSARVTALAQAVAADVKALIAAVSSRLPVTGGTMSGAINEAPLVSLASAATVNIGAAAANTIQITGTTAINGFDAIVVGAVRRLMFSGALTLVHDSNRLILPGGASIVTAPGDVVTLLSLGSGSWRCVDYARASGAAVFPASNPNLLTNSAFMFNQRVFQGGALAAGNYGHDRWGAYNGGCNYTTSGSRVTLASGTMCQVVEAAGLAGSIVVFSVEDPSAALTVTLGNGTGSNAVSGTITAGSGRQGVALIVPSTVAGDLKVRISGANASFSRPKLEVGRVATPWSPPDAATERARCLRYYEKSYVDSDAPGTATTTGYINWFFYGSRSVLSYMHSFSYQKRAVPALTLYSSKSGAAGKVYDVSADTDVNAQLAVGVNGFRNYFVPQNPTNEQINLGHHYVADAELACTD